MKKIDTNPDEHINNVREDVRADVKKLDKEISKIMKGETRSLWVGKFWGGTDQTIVAYGDYTYKRPKKPDVDWFKVGLAVQKDFISLYINGTEGDEYLVRKYGKTFGKVKLGASSVGFKSLEDINLDAVLEAVKKSKVLMSQD